MKKHLKYLIIPLVALIIFLVYQYPLTWDVTYHRSNSLSESSRELLSKLEKPLYIELITPDPAVSRHVESILSLFQKESAKIKLNVHTTALTPQEKIDFNLESNNTLILRYEARKKIVDLNMPKLNEQTLAKIIYQMLRDHEQWIVFLSGHGEQNPTGVENRHLSQLSADLKKKGFNIASLNTLQVESIPDNIKVLVIADSKKALLPKEMNQIFNYLNRGGNLLWLANPGSYHKLEKLAEKLGIQWKEGTILDPKAHTLGTPHPAISLVMQYPEHPLASALDMLTVFPWAMPLDYSRSEILGWQANPFLKTEPSTTLQGSEESQGPYTIGVALTKEKQRVIVIGNGHFLSNSTLHNYGNLALSTNIFNWLSDTDALLVLPSKPAMDLTFIDNGWTSISRKYIFPYCLPLIFLVIGGWVKRARYQKYTFLASRSKILDNTRIGV